MHIFVKGVTINKLCLVSLLRHYCLCPPRIVNALPKRGASLDRGSHPGTGALFAADWCDLRTTTLSSARSLRLEVQRTVLWSYGDVT